MQRLNAELTEKCKNCYAASVASPLNVFQSPKAVLRNVKEFDQIPAQDRFLLGVLQKRRVEDKIHPAGPAEAIVGPVKDLADDAFGNHVPQALFVKDHRVDEELFFEILTGL